MRHKRQRPGGNRGAVHNKYTQSMSKKDAREE